MRKKRENVILLSEGDMRVVKPAGNWRVYHDPERRRKKWIAENPSGSRPRKGFFTKGEAITYALDQYQLSLGQEFPLSNLDEGKRSIIRTIAALLNEARPEDQAAWSCLASVDNQTRQCLHQIAPRIMSFGDKHKASTLALAICEKFEATCTNWTVLRMVDERLKEKEAQIASLPTEEERQVARDGHFKQVVDVGRHMVEFLGADTDIDSITSVRMDEWKKAYQDYRAEKRQRLGRNTSEAKVGIAASFFLHANARGWKGTAPCKAIKVGNDGQTVALTFEEAAGVIVALCYLDKKACRAFVIEIFGLVRAGEVRGMRRLDITLETLSFKVQKPKLSSNYSQRVVKAFSNLESKKRSMEVIDTLFQWLMFLDDPTEDLLWPESKGEMDDVFLAARKIAGCLRWSHKDTGRHTGVNVFEMWGVPLSKIRSLMGHAAGSNTLEANYLGEMKYCDAAAIPLITPFNLGLIDAPYPYRHPVEKPSHVGNQLWLRPDRKEHQKLVAEYLPKLKEIQLRIKTAMGIE